MTTAAEDSSSREAPARRSPRFRFAPFFWLIVFGGLVFLAVRSFKHSDVVAVYTRSGNIEGVLSHRGRLLLVLTNLSFGREKALTADVTTMPVRPDEDGQEGEKLYEMVYKQWPSRKEFGGFGFAQSGKGELVPQDPASHVALMAPHWFVAGLAGLPVLAAALGSVRRLRRGRQGKCRHCGYPLPPNALVCPECGQAV